MKVVCIPSLAVSRTWEIILVERVLMFIKKKQRTPQRGRFVFARIEREGEGAKMHFSHRPIHFKAKSIRPSESESAQWGLIHFRKGERGGGGWGTDSF